MTRRVRVYRRRHLSFSNRIRSLRGRQVEVTTPYGNIVGELQTVTPGYLVINNEDGVHFVRINAICWLRPAPT